MPSSALTWEKSKGQEFPSTVLIKKKKPKVIIIM